MIHSDRAFLAPLSYIGRIDTSQSGMLPAVCPTQHNPGRHAAPTLECTYETRLIDTKRRRTVPGSSYVHT
jgi:hypothetical protein